MSYFKNGIAGVVGALAIAGSATAADFTMTIAAGASPNSAPCAKVLMPWAEKIKEQSNGRIDYNLVCGGVLGKTGDTVNRVAEGVADFGWDIPLIYGARFDYLGVVAVPGTYSDQMAAAGALWNLYSDGTLANDSAVRMSFFQINGNLNIWSSDPIADVANLDGLKVAAGSKERANLISELKGVPVALGVPEYYQAASKGAVNGILTNAALMFSYSITDVLSNSTVGPFGGGVSIFFMNNDFYNSLPDDLKAVIDANTGYEASLWATEILKAEDEELMAGGVASGKITVNNLPEDAIQALAAQFKSVEDQWVAGVEGGSDYIAAFRKAYAAEVAK